MITSPADAAGEAKPASDGLYLLPLAIAILALALVVYFDLQTNLSFNDEYARRWTIQRFMDGHGLALWGANPGLVQLLGAGLIALTHAEPRFWRLAVVPLLAFGGYFCWLIARRLGADRFWSATAAAVVVAGPITLSLANNLATEPAFLGLFLGAAWFALRWILDGRGMWWCVLMSALATLQRPQAAGLVLGVSLGLWLARKSRKVAISELGALLALWLGVFAAYEIPDRIFRGIDTPGTGPLTQISQLSIAVGNLVSLPVMLGMLLLPFAVGMLQRAAGERHKLSRAEMIPVAIAFAGLVGAGKLIVPLHGGILPGITLGTWGLGPPTLVGTKTALFPFPLLLAFELLALAAAMVILIWRRRAWEPRLLGTGGVVLTVFAISQFLPLLAYPGFFDRYFVMIAAPLVPLLAAMASASDRRPRLSMGWAMALLIVGLGAYAVGQQDYTSWETARDVAARLAYAEAPPYEVQAGYEEVAQHVWIPAADDPTLPRDVDQRPMIYLVFANSDDRRPGASYSSLAPGRIIVVRAR
jgi:hypothetical protein